jgi:hypothetical protein
MKKLPTGILALAVALSVTACGGMMDRGRSASDPYGSSAAGSSAPSPADPYYEPGGTNWQPPD